MLKGVKSGIKINIVWFFKGPMLTKFGLSHMSKIRANAEIKSRQIAL